LLGTVADVLDVYGSKRDGNLALLVHLVLQQ
jgi:hypothetical protein